MKAWIRRRVGLNKPTVDEDAPESIFDVFYPANFGEFFSF